LDWKKWMLKLTLFNIICQKWTKFFSISVLLLEQKTAFPNKTNKKDKLLSSNFILYHQVSFIIKFSSENLIAASCLKLFPTNWRFFRRLSTTTTLKNVEVQNRFFISIVPLDDLLLKKMQLKRETKWIKSFWGRDLIRQKHSILAICSTCLSVCLPVFSICLGVYLPVCLSACLPIWSACLPICLSIWLPLYLSASLSVCPSGCLSVCPSGCLSVCLSIYLSVCLLAYLSFHLVAYLSVYLST